MSGRPFIFVPVELIPLRKAFSFLWDESCCILHQWWEIVSVSTPAIWLPPLVPKPLSVGCVPSLETLPSCLFCSCTLGKSARAVSTMSLDRFCWCLFGSRRLSEKRFCSFSVLWKWLITQVKAIVRYCREPVLKACSSESSTGYSLPFLSNVEQVKAIWKDHEGRLCLQTACERFLGK